MAQHRWELGRGIHWNHALQADYDAHGAAAFIYRVVERCSASELANLERYYLAHFANVYNVNRVNRARLDATHYDADRAEARQYAKTAQALSGRQQTPEHKANRQRAIDAARARGFVKRK
jgi:hypothetical protein